ncbi:chemotaxis protein CheD [Paenibacillus sp. SEL3]|jgi:chemotaxis protein CheD|uniref:Probable chemoreceptor glutamine deamidase CheD n=2 Tax=Paenibacillus TaxID=44249 RepID=A0A074L7G9_PAEPO|nr:MULTISPECIES: chemotaxis protein CheD [Paenibacillus]KAF6637624.1 chemotaxis protein CheD [Paenibacillus sp. EKM208P]MCF2718634.1 chemotaxis protein CheD [Paenibacillus sp. UKAQ_18]ADM69746.1 chemotaxis protein CheD [Paenibacillus polymyxa E681]AHC19608.1 chemotaxis protein CheD [Paenibacillus polymyxa CR1]AHM65638.1 chemoreceptor glutamine deamidase ched [Paenibacillus polymyxa SQR-21]
MIEDKSIIKVGMADLNVTSNPNSIRTTGLGSCVGLTLYDPHLKLAGMAHVMLPSSDIAREGQLNIAKYADTALPELFERMLKLGAERRRLIAKMAGGAQMFAFAGSGDTMRIGPRNVESCKEMLVDLGIPLIAEDTGGNYGRTIELDSETGVLNIRSVQKGVKEL